MAHAAKATAGRARLVFVGLGAAVVVLFVLDLALGSVFVPFSAVLDVLFGKALPQEHEPWRLIVLQLRLPKAVGALLAGSALAVGGLAMQSLFRNPLAGPSVLGISGGASLGVAVAVLGVGGGSFAGGMALHWGITLGAVVGASGVLLLVLFISYFVRDYVVLLIVGLMLGNLALALVSIWLYYSEPELIRAYLFWTFGSLSGITLQQLPLFVLLTVGGLLVLAVQSKALNLLALGEAYAQSMGLRLKRTRLVLILATGVLVGVVTAYCGPIAFVGIAVPHLARGLLRTSNHWRLLPASLLMGMVLLLLCDIIAQLPGSALVLPINAVTALVGAPVILVVILRARNLSSAF